MDVDRLRPGTIHLAPEAVLWFEFLLSPALLEKHLALPNPDPSPVELMIKFLGIDRKEEIITIDEESGESERHVTNKITKRSLAIKLLTLKVMAHLEWNLNILESKLPLPMQVSLLLDLLFIAVEEEVNISTHMMMNFKTVDHQTTFAVSLYHRWVLQAFMSRSIMSRQTRVPFIPIPGLPDPNLLVANREEIYAQLDVQVMDSVGLMSRLLVEVERFVVPTFHSFMHMTEETTDLNTKWTNGHEITLQEFRCQIHFEMGSFSFFREDYPTAKHHFAECYKLFEAMNTNSVLNSGKFCSVKSDELQGYCLACDVSPLPPMEMAPVLERFKFSVLNEYTGILQILEADNVYREIPIIDRDMLEMDIQVAMSSGTFTVAKDLLFKIQILNVLRRAVDNTINNTDLLHCLTNAGDRGLEFFFSCLKMLMYELDRNELENLKYFLLDLIIKDLGTDSTPLGLATIVFGDQTMKSIFSDAEVQEVERKLEMGASCSSFTPTATSTHQVSIKLISRSPRLELLDIQQQLIQTYHTASVKLILQKLCSKDPSRAWWKLNSKWDLPIPLQSVVMTLPRGLTLYLVYILLAKAKEMSAAKNFRKAILLLEDTVKEIKETASINSTSLFKLLKLIDWEVLLVQINQYIEEYPDSDVDPGQLATSCKACLAASQAGDSVIPRLEVMENCGLALLNLGEWDTLTAMDKRWIYLELAAAIALACQDINKYKGSKKISREAWDLVLPVFGPSTQSKRNNSGSTASPTGSNLSKNALVNFLICLRESTCLSVVISLLARLHNVLRDEPNLEINCQHIGLWPAVVSNSNSYHSRSVAEVLSQVIVEALRFMPHNFQHLKVLGDLNYVFSDWSSALRYYLEAGAIASDFFCRPVDKHVLDDFVYKRMIKCCSQLQCHTQAAVLCQFMEEVDYTTAFKSLSETKSSHCADAMDAYYPCLWDLTILEFLVNMHSKRGETNRKQQVVKLIGLLELNTNNNEEIQREASNIRRGHFLRALINQYSISSNISAFSYSKQSSQTSI